MQTRISVDGRIQTPEEASVRVLDHGFLFGDSAYEVLWWHRGALVQADDHWERLEASAARLYMDLQHSRAALEAAVRATVAAAGVGPQEDALVRVVVTRGVGPPQLDLRTALRRTLVVLVAPASRPTPEAFERGLHLHVGERRRTSARALDPRAKTGNYLNNVLALHEAVQAGADDALFLNEAGEVAEATTSNVWLVREGAVRTPVLGAGILEGTTRRRILALCAQARLPASEARLLPADLEAAEEVFVSSSVRGVMPVTRLGGRGVGTGRVGPVTRRVRDLFEAAADADARRAGGVPA
ncbi:MAG: aminotransferase class IV [Planctomycetia bacterium]